MLKLPWCAIKYSLKRHEVTGSGGKVTLYIPNCRPVGPEPVAIIGKADIAKPRLDL